MVLASRGRGRNWFDGGPLGIGGAIVRNRIKEYTSRLFAALKCAELNVDKVDF
jgi:hypothetical protein